MVSDSEHWSEDPCFWFRVSIFNAGSLNILFCQIRVQSSLAFNLGRALV